MNKFLLLIMTLITTQASAIVILQGNDTNAPFGFTVPVNVSAYDPFAGTFFVGLTAGGGTSAISVINRPTFFNGTQAFTPIATNALVTNLPIEMLAIAQQQTQLSVVGAVIESGSTPFSQTMVTALLADGSQATQTAALNDASGAATTAGIVSLAANPNFFFAAVRPNGGNFGAANSGIALIGIATTPSSLTLTVKNAVTGIPGNAAVPFQNDSVQLDGGTHPVVFQTVSATNLVATIWDQTLQRLYIGTLITTGATAGDIAKSVVAGRLDATNNNALVLDPIVANSAITPGGNEIIVTQNNGVQESVSARQLGVMHASTGPDYLIVNGGRDLIPLVGNLVFALPLVNNPTNPAINGTLANKNAALQNQVFVQPALAPGDLPTNTDPAAIVGDGPLPMQPSDQVSQMTVVGDTVYVALDLSPSALRDTGIFYSQALFGFDGKIIRWTPWQRAFPFTAFQGITLPGSVTSDGAILTFAVDTQTGNIIAVEGSTGRVAGITNWTTGTGTAPTSLSAVLSAALCNGVYAVLDLNQATRGFQGNTPQRYALFGGFNKVAFARISQAFDDTLLTGPQQVITDFSQPQNFLVTKLPAGAGSVQVLEYSRTTTLEPNNFFFAGTNTGLFAFADINGGGFPASALGLLNQTPFTSEFWQKVPNISGSIIDIKTSGDGQTLYVLSLQSTCQTPLQTVLYSIPFTSFINTMFAPANIRIIAQTGQGVFSNVLAFYGIQIVATDSPTSANPADKEQVILATSQGLFGSHADQTVGNGLPSATNQTAAQWQLVDDSGTTAFYGIGAPETPIPSTVWPFSIADAPQGCKTFAGSVIYQVSAQGNSTGTAALIGTFLPPFFNANPLSPAFVTLPPIIYFFSDGARRLFVTRNFNQNPVVTDDITVVPYNVAFDNQTTPTTILVPATKNQRFYWIQEIGDSGLIMAGTGTGVIALS